MAHSTGCFDLGVGRGLWKGGPGLLAALLTDGGCSAEAKSWLGPVVCVCAICLFICCPRTLPGCLLLGAAQVLLSHVAVRGQQVTAEKLNDLRPWEPHQLVRLKG